MVLDMTFMVADMVADMVPDMVPDARGDQRRSHAAGLEGRPCIPLFLTVPRYGRTCMRY